MLRSFMRAWLVALGVAGASVTASAQDYPTRPIRIIVPFGAGGPADVAARLIGNVLQEKFHQAIVVENPEAARVTEVIA